MRDGLRVPAPRRPVRPPGRTGPGGTGSRRRASAGHGRRRPGGPGLPHRTTEVARSAGRAPVHRARRRAGATTSWPGAHTAPLPRSPLAPTDPSRGARSPGRGRRSRPAGDGGARPVPCPAPVAVDSLSAVKHARVEVLRDATGLAVDFETEGEFPAYGNNDDRVDALAVGLVESFMAKVREHPAYREAEHTQSVLTITSNVVYGRHTGNTPDGRRAGQPFAPGANPMNGRDRHGVAASALSVAKLPYEAARDGISLTTTITPEGLGHVPGERAGHLVGILDACMASGGFHMNVNVLDRATLEDAMDHPEKYPELTVRVSGYAVNFVRLTREQQLDVISRTFHGSL
ncbi:glycine radical domain-containing protein [Streptomyces sp. YIM B13518]|uniref:glycine radical domain-containing protein n=1 Tax=Streptomyces sp. YIM B13518 TaxID=3366316 RepID=UPI0036CBFBBC